MLGWAVSTPLYARQGSRHEGSAEGRLCSPLPWTKKSKKSRPVLDAPTRGHRTLSVALDTLALLDCNAWAVSKAPAGVGCGIEGDASRPTTVDVSLCTCCGCGRQSGRKACFELAGRSAARAGRKNSQAYLHDTTPPYASHNHSSTNEDWPD